MKDYFTLFIVLSLGAIFLMVPVDGAALPAHSDHLKAVPIPAEGIAVRNVQRAMQLFNRALDVYFTGKGDDLAMARYYNPFNHKRSSEKASIWMYGTSMEAAIAILKSLKTLKNKGYKKLYNRHFLHYTKLLKKLFKNAEYYLGTFTLTSFTRTKKWTVYAVNRSDKKGQADVTGVLNVYDDQMWLIRDFIHAFQVTGDKEYLQRAEYLTSYVLDGWDVCLDSTGKEIGGIPWGPGYVTKHACSNGPLISSLVWLHKFYKTSDATTDYFYINKKDKVSRSIRVEKKADYYLDYAEKIYSWEKKHLMNATGVYADMLGGEANPHPVYEWVNGIRYRKSTPLKDKAGASISYNSGAMLSGGSCLYSATGDTVYLNDVRRLSDAAFHTFASLGKELPGYYSYVSNGFNDWFNIVLLRGFLAAVPYYGKAVKYVQSFQKNIDFSYGHYLYKGMLPVDLLKGWNKKKNNRVEGMFMFAYATRYALLAQYELQNAGNTNKAD